jgi:hypothetical protein
MKIRKQSEDRVEKAEWRGAYFVDVGLAPEELLRGPIRKVIKFFSDETYLARPPPNHRRRTDKGNKFAEFLTKKGPVSTQRRQQNASD